MNPRPWVQNDPLFHFRHLLFLVLAVCCCKEGGRRRRWRLRLTRLLLWLHLGPSVLVVSLAALEAALVLC